MVALFKNMINRHNFLSKKQKKKKINGHNFSFEEYYILSFYNMDLAFIPVYDT